MSEHATGHGPQAEQQDEGEAIACPCCSAALEVAWELYRVWSVVRVKGMPTLDVGSPEFEGGTCGNCGAWIDPEDLHS